MDLGRTRRARVGARRRSALIWASSKAKPSSSTARTAMRCWNRCWRHSASVRSGCRRISGCCPTTSSTWRASPSPASFYASPTFRSMQTAVVRANPETQVVWLTGDRAAGDDRPTADALMPCMQRPSRSQCRGGVGLCLLAVLHLGNHGASQSGRADAWADGVRDQQSSQRPHAGRDRGRWFPRAGAAVARRRGSPAQHDRPRRQDGVAAVGPVRSASRRSRSSRSTGSPTCSPFRPS